MNRVRVVPSLYYSIICCFIFSCSENTVTNNLENSSIETEDKVEHLYRDFKHFPDFQFKKISLGETLENLENKMANMPVEMMAEEEVSYFYFPADSIELILPLDPVLNEFKVFLKGSTYLENRTEFREFLGETATESALDEDFPVYYYESEKLAYKVTYFERPKFIRLHFILLKIKR